MSVKKTFGGKGYSLYGEGNSGLDAVVHGKGPLVGRIMLASETTKDVVPIMPLEFRFRNWRTKRGEDSCPQNDRCHTSPKVHFALFDCSPIGLLFYFKLFGQGIQKGPISGFHRSLASSSGFRVVCCCPTSAFFVPASLQRSSAGIPFWCWWQFWAFSKPELFCSFR